MSCDIYDSLLLEKDVYETCSNTILGHIKIPECYSKLIEKRSQQTNFESLVADVFAMLDTETQLLADDSPERERLQQLVEKCQTFVGEGLLKERLSDELAEALGLIQSRQQFQSRYVKTKTRLYYKQQKFNLLREENEGWAKLLTELGQEHLPSSVVFCHMQALIGNFDLDPNRVLDIVLDACEARPQFLDFYLEIIQQLKHDKLDLCHTLGRKFTFYQEAKGQDTPKSLHQVSAVFIKDGLIDLDQLYTYLWPSDAKLTEAHNKALSDAKAYVKKSTAIFVGDDKQQRDKDDADKEEEIDEPRFRNNQKLDLCEALLDVGDWTSAKALLDRFPEHLACSHVPLARALCHLLHFILEPVYRRYCTLPPALLLRRCTDFGADSRRSGIAQAREPLDLVRLAFPIAAYLGEQLSIDPVLCVKFCRIGEAYLERRVKHLSGTTELPVEPVYQAFFNLLDGVLLPALDLVECNHPMAESVWALLKYFPYDHRYRLYSQWKANPVGAPNRLRQRADTVVRCKYIMKRLTKDNVRPMGRQLGKLSHSQPIVVFDHVLNQIQRYDNMIVPVVDALRYLGSLGYDVLGYCIIENLAQEDKPKLEELQLSNWFQSLCTFTGLLCKKYTFDLAGLLQFILNQLKAGKSYDLLILREVLHKMSGIETSEDTTSEQLEAMLGGELLRSEGGYFAQVRNTRKSSTRLKDTLIEHKMALPFMFMMSQQRDGEVFHEDQERHVKLCGKLFDQCQDTLVQFGTFLSLQLSTDEFVAQCPSIDRLMGEFFVPTDAAFFLLRSGFAHRINILFEEKCREEERRLGQEAKAENMQTNSESVADGQEANAVTIPIVDNTDSTVVRITSQTRNELYREACRQVTAEVCEQVRPMYTARVWEDLNIEFFVIFWSLQSADLHVPIDAYQRQMTTIKSQIHLLESDATLSSSKKKKEQERCQQLVDKLLEEQKRMTDHVTRVHSRLRTLKEEWFTRSTAKTDTVSQFLQLCVFPRALFTACDAVYAARFIQVLHQLKTPNFSTLICFDRVFNDITLPLASLTENEAHRYGRFLASIMDMVMRWHLNKEIYEKECQSFPGFVTVFRKGADNYNNKADQLEYENYRHVVHKWHYRITKAFVACLEHGYYVQIRNALIVMTKMLNSYPKIVQFGQAIERRVDKLRQEEKDKRPDLQAVAQGYLGMLRHRHSSWVSEADFHQKDATKAAVKATAPTSVANATANGEVKKTVPVAPSIAASADTKKVVPVVPATKVATPNDKRSSVTTATTEERLATQMDDTEANRCVSVKDNEKSNPPIPVTSNGTKRTAPIVAASTKPNNSLTSAATSISKDGGSARRTTSTEDVRDTKRRKVEASGGSATKDDENDQQTNRSRLESGKNSTKSPNSESHHRLNANKPVNNVHDSVHNRHARTSVADEKVNGDKDFHNDIRHKLNDRHKN